MQETAKEGMPSAPIEAYRASRHMVSPEAQPPPTVTQALVHAAMAPSQPGQMVVVPCVAVHVCTLFFYCVESVAPSCALTSRWGTTVRPLHYALWWNSMSAQLLTLHALERLRDPKTLAT